MEVEGGVVREVEGNLRSIFRSENTAPQKFIYLEPFSFQTLDHHQFDGQRPIEIENSMDSPVTEKRIKHRQAKFAL